MTSTTPSDAALRRAVAAVAILNLAYFGVEFSVALAIGSVSLFADSVDFLEDASINLLILMALGWSAGTRARVGMALAAILLVPGAATLWTAWQKFSVPVPPAPLPLSLAGAGALAVSAAIYLPPGGAYALLLASLLAGALALGTVWSGMMLGHWYLVTPRLAPRPLLRLTAALAAVLVVQAILLAGQALAGAAADLLGAPLSLLFWLRVAVGVVFPLALCFLVWRTARVRSMMSATGLLYIALGTVLTGQIIASALFFVSETPV